MNHEQKTIWAFVQDLNRLWTTLGVPERLVDYFAPEMVAICPTERLRLEGQAACVAGWTSFVRAAKTLRFIEANPYILMLAKGQAAVVAYDFEIDYEMSGHLVQMRGRDLMTLEQREGRWWLVADQFAPTPE